MTSNNVLIDINKREDRHRKSVLQQIEQEQSTQYVNEINDVQVARLAEVEQLVRSLPDGEWRNYRLKTSDKGRSLTCNDKPVVEWHLDHNQNKGTSNHGIKTSDLRALADWDRELKELKKQKQLRLKAQQQKMLEAQQKTKANANATKILQLLRSWKQKKPRTTLPEGYRAIDGEEKGERILLKGDREILRLKKSGLITGDARGDDVRILQKWHEQHIGHTARRKRQKRQQNKELDR